MLTLANIIAAIQSKPATSELPIMLMKKETQADNLTFDEIYFSIYATFL